MPEPRFTDTALIRMKDHNLQQWQVIRAFESSEKSYLDNNKTVGRADIDGRMISAVYCKQDDGKYLIITCWAKDKKDPDRLYRQRYGKWPKR